MMKARMGLAIAGLLGLAATGLASGLSVRIEVRDAKGQPQEAICAIHRDRLKLIETGTDAEGEIESGFANLYAGSSYSVKCRHLSYAPAEQTAYQPATALLRQEGGRYYAKVVFDKPELVVPVEAEEDEQIAFVVQLPEWRLQNVRTPAGVFQRFRTEEDLFFRSGEEQLSLPETPLVTTQISIPLGARIREVTVRPLGGMREVEARLYPVQPEGTGASGREQAPAEFRFDEGAWLSGGASYAKPQIVATRQLNANLHKLLIAPVHYDPRAKLLSMPTKLMVDVRFSRSEDELDGDCYREAFRDPRFPLDQVDEAIESMPTADERLIVNWDSYSNRVCLRNATFAREGTRYLILTPRSLAPAAELLRAHRTAMGLSAEVRILDPGMNDRMLKALLREIYETQAIKPKYVLLLGDVEHIPTHYGEENFRDDARNAGDYWYAQFGAADASTPPAFAIGRLPVDPDPAPTAHATAAAYVKRVIEFELAPPQEASYYGRWTFASHFPDALRRNADGVETVGGDGRIDVPSYAELAEKLRARIVPRAIGVQRIYEGGVEPSPREWNDGTTLAADLVRPNYQWTAGPSELLSSIGEGTAVLFHRGHGWWDRWDGPSLRQSHLADLQVRDRQWPVVFSVNCASGMFDNETVDAPSNIVDDGYGPDPERRYLAEEFVLSPNGALAFVGDTRTSATGINDVLTRGLFDALLPKGDENGQTNALRRVGDVLNYAKAYLAKAQATPGAAAVSQHQLIYNLLGDPALEIPMRMPLTMTVEQLEHVRFPDGDEPGMSQLQLQVRLHDPLCQRGEGCDVVWDDAFPDREKGLRVVVQDPETGKVIARETLGSENAAIVILPSELRDRTVTITISGTDVTPRQERVRID
jgi:hypothetical protein